MKKVSTAVCQRQALSKQRFCLRPRLFILLFSFTVAGIVAPVLQNVAHAQNAPAHTVTGVVRNDAGEPLEGISVAVKGAENGTATGKDGHYKISVSSAGSILVFSSVGYTSQEVKVGNNSTLDISLKAQTGNMNEVVVVGYGSRKRTTLTGAVSTVDSKTFQDRGPVSSPLAALQGQVPGVNVSRTSAQPGRENWNFQIRGVTSTNGTEPLVIVDGLPVPSTSALNSLNPNHIDNISFLKDAAAAIYGARAAGGVVIITTKKAKSGKAIIDYNGSVSRKIIGLQPKLVDINGWGPMMKEARTADGYGPTDLWYSLASASIFAKSHGMNWMSKKQYDSLGYAGFSDVKDFMFFDGTMQDVMWGNATSTEHQLSIASRGEKAGYRISLGYLDDGSLLQWGNNSNKRYNVRLANDYQVSQKLKIESNISLEQNNIIQPSNIGAVLNNGIQPGMPTSTIDGKPYLWGSGIQNATTNNIAQYGGDGKENNTRVNTNFNVTYNIAKNLKAIGSAGIYYRASDFRTQENIIPFYDYSGTVNLVNLTPSGTSRSFYQRTNAKETYYNLNGYLDYAKVFSTYHDFHAVLGAQYERDEFNSFYAKTLDVLNGVPPSLSLSTGDATTKTEGETQNHYALAGYFSRLNYTYKGKYILELDGRYDGSSKFIADSRWKFFYGVSGAWRISQENFMKNLGVFNDFKLRASWGSVGNQSGIGLYDYIQTLNLSYSTGATASGYPIIGTAPVVRVAPNGTLVSLDRTWEKIETSDVGIDYTLLGNRLSGSFDYYIKRNPNMLIARSYPSVLGATAPAGNNGNLKVWGWELSLNWRDHLGKFNYHFGGNISDSRNELVGFGGQTFAKTVNNGGYYAAVEGYPLNSYFGLQYNGRIQDQKTLDDYKKLIPGNTIAMPGGSTVTTGLQLGDNMYKDVNGDGKITNADFVNLGSDVPRYTYSFNGGFEYKGFDFNFIFQGVAKRTILRGGNWRIPAATVFQAQNEAFYNQWWTPTRTDAFYPRISTTGTINNYNYYASDFSIQNGSYLRLKNLVVGYTIPQSITQRIKIQRLRVYFSGNDLWEVTKIKDGWDPETTKDVANTGDSNNNNVSTFSQRFPFYRYLTFGLNLTF